MKNSAILLISCPDRPGIVAGVSRFLYESGANIVRSDQYSTDPEGGTFFLRMEFALAPEKRDGLGEQFGLKVAEPLADLRKHNAYQISRVGYYRQPHDEYYKSVTAKTRKAWAEAAPTLKKAFV